MKIGYVNVFVSNLSTTVSFFENTLGLMCNSIEVDHGYASFTAGPISFGIAQTDESALIGRHTGIGFMVDDIDQTYSMMRAAGVEFTMAPTKQPWGGTLALFNDPDGNLYYLDPGHQTQ
ncbi:MAG: VOC family protein [Pseudomonadales bacterium]|jgi:predicted enzyme related to lactoylglutathione lyase|nr:VOC family protein [Pseudomonadales bacterium]